MTSTLERAFDRRFPTRHYPYRGGCGHPVFADQTDPLADVAPGSVVRFFLGGDEGPVLLGVEELIRSPAN